MKTGYFEGNVSYFGCLSFELVRFKMNDRWFGYSGLDRSWLDVSLFTVYLLS